MEVSASRGRWWETCCIRPGVGVGPASLIRPQEVGPGLFQLKLLPGRLGGTHALVSPPTQACPLHQPCRAGLHPYPVSRGREPRPVQPVCKGCPLVAVQGTHPASPHQTRSSSLPTPPTALPGDPALFQNVPCHPHPHAGPRVLHLRWLQWSHRFLSRGHRLLPEAQQGVGSCAGWESLTSGRGTGLTPESPWLGLSPHRRSSHQGQGGPGPVLTMRGAGGLWECQGRPKGRAVLGPP